MSAQIHTVDPARLHALIERLDPTADVCRVPGCRHEHGPHAAAADAVVAHAA